MADCLDAIQPLLLDGATQGIETYAKTGAHGAARVLAGQGFSQQQAAPIPIVQTILKEEAA